MNVRYAIHPSVGIARVGNSTDFYLAPVAVGGLPIECDEHGTARRDPNGELVCVRTFKTNGAVRRQGARFSVYAHDDTRGTRREVTLGDEAIESIEWTVHIANKKACWYPFQGRVGDTSVDPENTYAKNGVTPRNAGAPDRKKLIVDPGPRTLSGAGAHAELSAAQAGGYVHCSFPDEHDAALPGRTPVRTLGEARTDAAGRLVVIGAMGAAIGPPLPDAPFPAVLAAAAEVAVEADPAKVTVAAAVAAEIRVAPDAAAPAAAAETPVHDAGFAPRGRIGDEYDGWYDDVGDGPVVCTITFKDPRIEPVTLRAWCIVVPPKFAPELVSAVTLDDVMLDVAVRHFGLLPLGDDGPAAGTPVNFDRDIAPIIARAAQAVWPTGMAFASSAGHPAFDPRDASNGNRRNRERYASLFRRDPKRFFDPHGVPMYPVQPGADQIGSTKASFDTLTPTQLRMLDLWAQGAFADARPEALPDVDALDRVSVGNCVGSPMDPGVEATWTLRDPRIYEAPWRIRHRHPPEHYRTHGLSPDENEQDGEGCEPGDLTKRLVAPWHFDMLECGSVHVFLNDGRMGEMPSPPQYVVTWWPAQRPFNVVVGIDEDPTVAGGSAGTVANWNRPAYSPIPFLMAWTKLGFVANANRVDGAEYPMFTEVERQDVGTLPLTAFDAAYLAAFADA
jgi:L-lysine 6-oxidase